MEAEPLPLGPPMPRKAGSKYWVEKVSKGPEDCFWQESITVFLSFIIFPFPPQIWKFLLFPVLWTVTQILEALSSWSVEIWSLKRYLRLLKYMCKVTPIPPSHLLISLLKEKISRVDVKATGCHFPLNSTKHMGAGLRLSQIVKIFFFKKPKSSRDGSKCASFPWAVSSTTFTLADIFINTHTARQDPAGYWSTEPETELRWLTYMRFHFVVVVTDLPQQFPHTVT